MKKSVITSVLAVLTALTTIAGAQNYPKEYLGLPGDNLNLYAVLDLFRNSPTLEAFERSLNDRDSRINNLDLNGDWRVDYIAVSDYRHGRVHNIVLRAVLGRNEYQDVAVITVERLKKKRVVIQIIGDELLYGRNYIIEPAYARKHRIRHEYNPVYYYGSTTIINNYYYDIWDWPVVVHIYSPHYTGWSSSWYWGYYPTWYEPWSPWYWDYYYGYHSGWHHHYHSYYRHSDRYRYHGYNDYYYHRVRQESPQVQRRVAESTYRQTYSRPEQRAEGAELARRTREAVSRDTRSQEARTREARGSDTRSSDTRSQTPASADGTRRDVTRTVSGTVPADGRRTTAGTTGRSAAETEATRRADPGKISRSAEETEAARRGGTGTVSRDATVNEAARRTPAAVKSSENEAAEAREAEAREAQAREAQQRAAEARAEQQRAAEQRAAEARAEQQRAAEQRAAEARAEQQRANEQRANEQRAAQAREAERRSAEAREAQAREAQAREAQQRAAEQRAAEARAAEQKTRESGSERPVRK